MIHPQLHVHPSFLALATMVACLICALAAPAERAAAVEPDLKTVREVPATYPVAFWYHDGVFYHYVLSCCKGTEEEQDYGVVVSDEPIATSACTPPVVTDGPHIDSGFVFDYSFTGENTQEVPHNNTRENVDPLAFRGIKRPAPAQAGPEPGRPPLAPYDYRGRFVKFTLDAAAFPDLRTREFVLYAVNVGNETTTPPRRWKGKSVVEHGGEQFLFVAVEISDQLFSDPSQFHVPTGGGTIEVKYKSGGKNERSRKTGSTSDDGPLFVGELDFSRSDFPGWIGDDGTKVPVYIIMLDRDNGWGDLGPS